MFWKDKRFAVAPVAITEERVRFLVIGAEDALRAGQKGNPAQGRNPPAVVCAPDVKNPLRLTAISLAVVAPAFERMERETGIEPATSSLGSWHSTAELLPLDLTPVKSYG